MIININRTPIQITINKNKKREEKFLHWLKICKEKNSLRQVSNVGGIQTENFPLSMIKDSFKQDIDQYLNSFNKKCNFKWKINGCWVNENYYGDFNMPHNHAASNSQFSGIWYLKVKSLASSLSYLYEGYKIEELVARGLALDACCSELDACCLLLEELGA
jgi:hypothetical protein